MRIPKIDIKEWKTAMYFSFVSYSMLLFMIVALVVFISRDFNLIVVGLISGSYMAAVLLLMAVAAITFRVKIGK